VSSAQYARIRPRQPGPSVEWLLTLGGSKENPAYPRPATPIDRAYRAARDEAWQPSVSDIVPEPVSLLPAGIADAGTCRECPVRDVCMVATDE
jgi:hypothetical protein